MLHTAASAADPGRCIQEGDLVVVYEGFDSMKSVRVTAKGNYNNKFGSFAHAVSDGSRRHTCMAAAAAAVGCCLLPAHVACWAILCSIWARFTLPMERNPPRVRTPCCCAPNRIT